MVKSLKREFVSESMLNKEAEFNRIKTIVDKVEQYKKPSRPQTSR